MSGLVLAVVMAPWLLVKEVKAWNNFRQVKIRFLECYKLLHRRGLLPRETFHRDQHQEQLSDSSWKMMVCRCSTADNWRFEAIINGKLTSSKVFRKCLTVEWIFNRSLLKVLYLFSNGFNFSCEVEWWLSFVVPDLLPDGFDCHLRALLSRVEEYKYLRYYQKIADPASESSTM